MLSPTFIAVRRCARGPVAHPGEWRVPDMLRKNRQKILEALDIDFGGRSHNQSDLAEIPEEYDFSSRQCDPPRYGYLQRSCNFAGVKEWSFLSEKS
jgi:hypothetical protein